MRQLPHLQQLRLLDLFIGPLVQQLPAYVKDTSHALQILEPFTFRGLNIYLFTIDTVNDLTNAPSPMNTSYPLKAPGVA